MRQHIARPNSAEADGLRYALMVCVRLARRSRACRAGYQKDATKPSASTAPDLWFRPYQQSVHAKAWRARTTDAIYAEGVLPVLDTVSLSPLRTPRGLIRFRRCNDAEDRLRAMDAVYGSHFASDLGWSLSRQFAQMLGGTGATIGRFRDSWILTPPTGSTGFCKFS